MGHHPAKSGYAALIERINLAPQGAPPAATLYKILKILFSETDAALVAQLPIRPFTAKKAAAVWKIKTNEAQKILDDLSSRALLLDIEEDGVQTYLLPPPMAGFFEFSLMRIRNDIDQKALSELFFQYLNMEDDFIKALFTEGETHLGRVFVQEPSVPAEFSLLILDYEKATEVIKTASHRAVGICYCRHKMHHMDRDCGASKEICMTFNATARSLIKHGHARPVDIEECLALLQVAYDQNLVQFGSNVREMVAFICNCCGCCCEAMIAARRFCLLHAVHTTNFLPEIKEGSCTGCGQCVNVCPVEAAMLVCAYDPHRPKRKIARLREDICLGCGLCVRTCAKNSIRLNPRPMRVITPLNGAHLAVNMAIERGKLQNLIFDNQALLSHRAMAAILGAILKLPYIKQVLANKQLNSRYLESLINRNKQA